MRLLSAIAFLWLAVAQCLAGDVVFTNADFQNKPQQVRSALVYYLDGPTLTGSNNVTRDRVDFKTDLGGYFTITNYYPGNYRIELQGTKTTTTNWYEFPPTNGTINGTDPQWGRGPTNGITQALTVAAADSRYGPRLWDTNRTLGGTTNVTGPIRIDTRSRTNEYSMMLNSNVWVGTNGSVSGNFWSLNLDGSFQWGNGSGRLAADGSMSAGSVPDARLSSNVPLKNGTNVFTGGSNYMHHLYIRTVGEAGSEVYGIHFINPTNGNIEYGSLFCFVHSGHPNGEIVLQGRGSGAIVGGTDLSRTAVWQIGATPSGAGVSSGNNELFVLQDDYGINSGNTMGYSHFLGFSATYWNGSAGISRLFSLRHDILDTAGNSGLGFYAFTKGYSQTGWDSSNVRVGIATTNTFCYQNLLASNNVSGGFYGNGAGITNGNYACFNDTKSAGTDGDNIASNSTWTKATLNTTNFDSAAAFSLSSSVLTVNAAGAGRWKVRASVPLYCGAFVGKIRARLRRTNNTAATLMASQTQSGGNNALNTPCLFSGVVTLTAGDTLELQGWWQSTGPVQFGKSWGSDGEAEIYSMIEFERQ